MNRIFYLLFLFFPCLPVHAQKSSVKTYFPETNWERKDPAAWFDTAKLAQAVRLSRERESKSPRDLEWAHAMTFGKEPFGDGVGPFAPRGDVSGLIVHKGYIIAEWGEPSRVDMTFSVTKSFLSTVVGLAADKGLIRNVHDTVAAYMAPVEVYDALAVRTASDLGKRQLIEPFATPHNRTITWDHLLRQTSDWEGTLWDKPEWADRPDANNANWLNRKRTVPGAVYEYNDVRVNALALAATSVWR